MSSLLINSLLASFFVAIASEKRISPYIGALIFGAVKSVIYYVQTRNPFFAAIGFIAFSAVAACLGFLFVRFHKKSATIWELVPTGILIILLIFGEKIVFSFQR